jgi:ubiquinone/menaquinone biosynthesis C-methylase UbiE
MNRNNRDINFNRGAAHYDVFFGRMSRRFYRLLLEHVELTPGATVLDVGCGTGTLLRKMANICSINGFGIDMAKNMIVEAKRKCPEMDIQISRCEKTPFEDNTFDVVTTCMAYHHFSDKKGFAKEMSRILKPGGRLYIVDPYFPRIIRELINAVFNLVDTAGGFSSLEEIYEDFSVYGFKADGFAKDWYAQVIWMKLSDAK